MHPRKKRRNSTGFTLIELLIVVAIIAILAAIAVPNFLEAQIRAKISRAKSDMRTISTGLESYFIDNNKYAIGISYGIQLGLWGRNSITTDMSPLYKQLTTPVSYLSSIPADEFMQFGSNVANTGNAYRESNAYWYEDTETNRFKPARDRGYLYILRSWGPSASGKAPWPPEIIRDRSTANIYDATNGTKSIGFLLRTNKGEFTSP